MERGIERERTHRKAPRRVKRVLELLKRRPVDQGARPPRRHPRPQHQVGDHEPGGLHERHGPHRPREPGRAPQQLPCHGGEDEPARRAAARADADGEPAPRRKVRRHRRHDGAKQAPVAQAHAHPLRQEQLPVRRAERRGHEADQLEERAQQEQRAEVARVRGAAREGTDEEEEEDLDGPDPGDGRGGEAEGGGVVGLEDAKGVDVAPG